MATPQISESEFRSRVQEIFNRVDRALADVDPDVAEAELGLGTLTISFADRSKCILSTQPSLRQVWMAVASKGIAHHFVQSPDGRWLDDKGKGLELISCLRQVLSEQARIEISI